MLAGAQELLKHQSVDVIYIETGANPNATQQCYFPKIEEIMTSHGYRLFRIYEQRHEWLDDIPVLRRMNCAYFSDRFANAHPVTLIKNLSELKAEQEAITEQAQKNQLELIDRIKQLETEIQAFRLKQRELAELEAVNAKAELEAIEARAKLEASKARAEEELSQFRRQSGELRDERNKLTEELHKIRALNDFCGQSLAFRHSTMEWWTGAPIARMLDRSIRIVEIRRFKRLIKRSYLFDPAFMSPCILKRRVILSATIEEGRLPGVRSASPFR